MTQRLREEEDDSKIHVQLGGRLTISTGEATNEENPLMADLKETGSQLFARRCIDPQV